MSLVDRAIKAMTGKSPQEMKKEGEQASVTYEELIAQLQANPMPITEREQAAADEINRLNP